MSDRINALVVTLNRDLPLDEAESLIQAIRQFAGVIGVSGNVAQIGEEIVRQRVRDELTTRMWDVLYPKTKP